MKEEVERRLIQCFSGAGREDLKYFPLPQLKKMLALGKFGRGWNPWGEGLYDRQGYQEGF